MGEIRWGIAVGTCGAAVLQRHAPSRWPRSAASVVDVSGQGRAHFVPTRIVGGATPTAAWCGCRQAAASARISSRRRREWARAHPVAKPQTATEAVPRVPVSTRRLATRALQRSADQSPLARGGRSRGWRKLQTDEKAEVSGQRSAVATARSNVTADRSGTGGSGHAPKLRSSRFQQRYRYTLPTFAERCSPACHIVERFVSRRTRWQCRALR